MNVLFVFLPQVRLAFFGGFTYDALSFKNKLQRKFCLYTSFEKR